MRKRSSSNASQIADNSSGNQFGETSTEAADEVMDSIRALGRMPKETRGGSKDENLQAQKIRHLEQIENSGVHR